MHGAARGPGQADGPTSAAGLSYNAASSQLTVGASGVTSSVVGAGRAITFSPGGIFTNNAISATCQYCQTFCWISSICSS